MESSNDEIKLCSSQFYQQKLYRKKLNSTQVGFTLVELMITVIVLGILATIAVPNFNKQLAQQRTQQGGMDIVAIFNEARSNAALLNRPVTLSISNSNRLYEVEVGAENVAKYELKKSLTITTNVSDQLTVYPNGSIQGTDSYFRICDSKASGINGYSVWINPRGVAKYGSGKMMSGGESLKIACE